LKLTYPLAGPTKSKDIRKSHQEWGGNKYLLETTVRLRRRAGCAAEDQSYKISLEKEIKEEPKHNYEKKIRIERKNKDEGGKKGSIRKLF